MHAAELLRSHGYEECSSTLSCGFRKSNHVEATLSKKRRQDLILGSLQHAIKAVGATVRPNNSAASLQPQPYVQHCHVSTTNVACPYAFLMLTEIIKLLICLL